MQYSITDSSNGVKCLSFVKCIITSRVSTRTTPGRVANTLMSISYS